MRDRFTRTATIFSVLRLPVAADDDAVQEALQGTVMGALEEAKGAVSAQGFYVVGTSAISTSVCNLPSLEAGEQRLLASVVVEVLQR